MQPARKTTRLPRTRDGRANRCERIRAVSARRIAHPNHCLKGKGVPEISESLRSTLSRGKWLAGRWRAGERKLTKLCECRCSSRQQVKWSMGNFLQTLVPWDVYYTLTFSRPVSLDGVLYGARRYFDIVEKLAGRFSDTKPKLYGYIGVERGPNGGLLHAHGLMGNVGHLKTYCAQRMPPEAKGLKCCLLHAWPFGYARVVPYDPKLGAAHYVSKYVTKDLCEWELRGFPAVPQLSLRNPLYLDRSSHEQSES